MFEGSKPLTSGLPVRAAREGDGDQRPQSDGDSAEDLHGVTPSPTVLWSSCLSSAPVWGMAITIGGPPSGGQRVVIATACDVGHCPPGDPTFKPHRQDRR